MDGNQLFCSICAIEEAYKYHKLIYIPKNQKLGPSS